MLKFQSVLEDLEELRESLTAAREDDWRARKDQEEIEEKLGDELAIWLQEHGIRGGNSTERKQYIRAITAEEPPMAELKQAVSSARGRAGQCRARLESLTDELSILRSKVRVLLAVAVGRSQVEDEIIDAAAGTSMTEARKKQWSAADAAEEPMELEPPPAEPAWEPTDADIPGDDWWS